ncbi:hypothetical protein EDEG_02013 [Edhazardia aedis USNM 41457]|uniref:Endoplasmic reticulum transmembrane protein n=1 Tax=Edhazardia aedis (strain USNM 41457) TaxID=1003232 RepID=J9D833_EDHAE|nr:hypothetical protein EDEG_02013 [Edhazardia aedis USNM 41457]|eukprot:EJW03664.1 hypothetical protein EDEG_02013 [Edhazardia aedis USNM 41457]
MGITTITVQILLISELTLFTSLILPLPYKRSLISYFATSKSVTLRTIKHILLALYAMVTIMFIDSIHKVCINKGTPNLPFMYHAERNMYLTGFTLYIALIFYAFCRLLLKLHLDEMNASVLKKQSMSQKKFVEQILKEGKEKDQKVKDLEEKVKKNEALVKQAKNNVSEYTSLLKKYNQLIEKTTGENKKNK